MQTPTTQPGPSLDRKASDWNLDTVGKRIDCAVLALCVSRFGKAIGRTIDGVGASPAARRSMAVLDGLAGSKSGRVIEKTIDSVGQSKAARRFDQLLLALGRRIGL